MGYNKAKMAERNNCIFLVDDNPVYLNTGKSILQEKYIVITVPSGEQLEPMLQKIKPDLILLDVEMPGMSGYDIIKKIKADPRTADIPVIFLTGKDNPDNEIIGLSLGAVDYITKPFSAPLLLKRIELHLLMQSQRRELSIFNENLALTVRERTRDLSKLQSAIITWMAEMVEFRDEKTGKHVERVQKYLEILVTCMEKTERYGSEIASWDVEAFLNSAPLHDIGKIKISDDILLKESQLTDEEYEKMKLHTSFGKTLLESLQKKVPNQTFLKYAQTLAYVHHERWDGTGYPEGLKGTEIPLPARMMAIADVYDALISERSYKKAFSHEEAMRLIAERSGTHFDPELTELFISLSPEIKKAHENMEI